MQDKYLNIKRKYKNQWIARDADSGKVIASNKSLLGLKQKLGDTNTNYFLEKVLPPDVAFIS